ncbi:hypothetical protein TP70_06545 [Staphylococcus microti]|uniref:DUF4256 domain-containing protein n=1 Tax=Staphylococcus microti TaxID=569857 RepID=A0A0D6XP55_9STAP|nr:DUF4256 domain-containing protein [Staphylococcus microti]KIX90574.1 hypothetical protein TP70_06545 [Staphylococcus microti]PNZ77239.1 DUF4256 domain-containing protein [Staphylococcus microti]SUM56972.1 Uncharacterised protein [Staphylococcus microti]
MATLTQEQKETLIATLKARFEKYPERHEDITWEAVEQTLQAASDDKLWTLNEMERTEGEPDVIGTEDGAYLFVDCSAESPKGRRSVCYDQAALESRKKHKPETSAIALAEAMGITLLTEAQYRHLQTLGTFDKKTSSWIVTPDNIRDLGGALFCDYRYGTVFTYHNGAESYYAARGFRGMLKI